MNTLILCALAALLATLPAAPAAAGDESSLVRGGRLYDDWSREINERPPSRPNPAYAGGGASAADTWRCTECHGWDYKGSHGMIGIGARRDGDTAAIVAILKNPTHRYDELLRESDLSDLAEFVSHGQLDVQAAVDAARRAKGGGAFAKYYATICAGCHGLDGGQLREVLPLGDTARQRPFEVLHVIVNGHPGREMPALRALGADFAAQMLAFVQSLPSGNLAASIAHGGRLYDNWQIEEGAQRQSLPHPSYPRSGYYADDALQTWRCKECHGWDYLGSQGEYGSGRHATGIKGIRGMAGAEPARIVAVLRDARHRYGAVLKERDLLDLANFVSAGQMDMDSVIDRPTHKVRGDAARGAGYFSTICAVCHGSDGKRITTTLGALVRSNPWGGLHTVLNGHPDEKMPALRELDRQLAIDILAYVQSLPGPR